MPLDIKKDFANLRKAYEQTNSTRNLLIYGNVGAGKSHVLATAPRPMLIHSFDPGGCNLEPLRQGVEDSSIVVDTRWEKDDPKKPTVYAEWCRETSKLVGSGVFGPEGFRTFVLDSGTMWAEALMREVIKQDTKNSTDKPQLQNYLSQQIMMINHLQVLCNLPCFFILTGHMQESKNSEGAVIDKGLMVSGKLSVKIPLMFDEFLVLEAKRTPSGTERLFRTQPTGLLQARSRLASGGKLGAVEPADISAFLRKGGLEL